MIVEPTRLYATLVDRLSDVPGVVACAAFELDGQCLACFVGEMFEELGAGHVIPILRELAAPNEAQTPFEEGVTFVERRLVRVLMRRTPTSTFVVIVDPEGDVDVVVAHLGRALDVIARAARATSAPPAPVGAALPATMPPPPGHASGFYERQARAAESTLDIDPSTGRASAPPGARVIEEEALKRLEDLSLGNLGFAADVVWERIKASVANHAGQVPRGRWLELVGRLASEIEDDDAREKFVTEAMSLPARTVITSEGLDLLSPLARYIVERRTG